MAKRGRKKNAIEQAADIKSASPELRLVALHNVERRLAEGWKKVDIDKIKDGRGKILGVCVHSNDLVLMEKKG